MNRKCGTALTKGCRARDKKLSYSLMNELYCILSDAVTNFHVEMIFISPFMRRASPLFLFEVLLLDGWIDLEVHKLVTMRHSDDLDLLPLVNIKNRTLTSNSEPGRGGEILVVEFFFNTSSSMDFFSLIVVEVKSTYTGELLDNSADVPYHTLNYVCRAKMEQREVQTELVLSIPGDHYSLKISVEQRFIGQSNVKAYWVYDIFANNELFLKNLSEACSISALAPYRYSYCMNYSYNDHSKKRYLFFRKYFMRSPRMLFNNYSWVYDERKSWRETFRFCRFCLVESFCGNLPIIRSKQEMIDLLKFLKAYILPIEGIYIGLYMDDEELSLLNYLF